MLENTKETATTTKREEETVVSPEREEQSTVSLPEDLREYLEAGVQFGHVKSQVHPKMFPFIFGTRNNVHLIDVAKTKEQLNKVIQELKDLAAEGKKILFVGTKVPVRAVVREAAEELSMPYVVNRWYGGTLTNWASIYERIERLKELREKKRSEEWEKYTKHERLLMDREIDKLEHAFGGIETLEGLPDAVFIVDANEEEIATREARKTGIPSFAIVDTNVNPENVDYAIPANDDAVSSVELILNKVKAAIAKAQPKKPKKRTVRTVNTKKK